MKALTYKTVIVLFILVFPRLGLAIPLNLEYTVSTTESELYQYDFTLKLDNQDGSWESGQGWRWFTFGDAPFGQESPLTDFEGDLDTLPVGPWSSFEVSGGAHNGITFGFILDFWVPEFVGDFLSWSGTSSANLQQNELLFSTTAGTLGGAVAANFDIANRIEVAIPEPSLLFMFILAGAGLIITRKRQYHRQR